MKLTPDQDREMQSFEPEALKIPKDGKFLTYPQLRFRLKNLTDQNYPNLRKLKFGDDWICRRRKRLGLVRESITREESLKKVASIIRKRVKNSFVAVVTTKNVIIYWRKNLSETPTKANLRDFRCRFGFDVVLNPLSATKAQDAWILQK